MHLGNAALTPECALLTGGIAAAGVGWAAWSLSQSEKERAAWSVAGPLAAAVFAAQMINFQALPLSLSGHLVGGVLLAWVLGPALGVVAMTCILLLQAVLLGDGGLASLGANVMNMALLPAGLVWLAQRLLAREEEAPQGWTAAAVVGGISFLSVALAAGLIVGQVALGRGSEELAGLGGFAAQMLGVHAWLAVAEALLTLATLAALGAVTAPAAAAIDRPRQWGLAAVAAVLVLAVLPLASELPDGYETAAESQFAALLAEDPAALPASTAAAQTWQRSLADTIQGPLGDGWLLALTSTLLCGALVAAASLTPAPRRQEA